VQLTVKLCSTITLKKKVGCTYYDIQNRLFTGIFFLRRGNRNWCYTGQDSTTSVFFVTIPISVTVRFPAMTENFHSPPLRFQNQKMGTIRSYTHYVLNLVPCGKLCVSLQLTTHLHTGQRLKFHHPYSTPPYVYTACY
jgi:hypothetical protein